MHGVFLLDGQGTIRWQAVTALPFDDVNRLLVEAGKLGLGDAKSTAALTSKPPRPNATPL